MEQNKGIPIYHQIATVLKGKILQGQFEPGDTLPSENELAKTYKVSRVTVRQALDTLEKEKFIYRQRGRGTFVSDEAISLEPFHLNGSLEIEDIIPNGLKSTVKITNFSFTSVYKKVTDALGLPKGEKVLRIDKIRSVKDKPFSYAQIYTPPEIGAKINRETAGHRRVMDVLEEDLKMDLAEATAIQRLGAIVADSYIAPLLNVSVGDPLLYTERTIYDSKGKPIGHVLLHYRADRYAYKVHLSRRKKDKATKGNWKIET
ncbi:GntR family transcriptional regulator [Thermodesulfobacteriota bacterium]